MPVGLVIPKIPNPDSILEENLSRSFLFITFVPAFILEPRALAHSHKSFIDFLLALRNLCKCVFGTETVEHAVLELTFESDFAIRVREFTVAVHEVIFPLSAVRLAIGQRVKTVALPQGFFFQLVADDGVTHVL